jgi:hypothetical protein
MAAGWKYKRDENGMYCGNLPHVNALPGNGSVNTLRYTHTTMEQRGYATRF